MYYLFQVYNSEQQYFSRGEKFSNKNSSNIAAVVEANFLLFWFLQEKKRFENKDSNQPMELIPVSSFKYYHTIFESGESD